MQMLPTHSYTEADPSVHTRAADCQILADFLFNLSQADAKYNATSQPVVTAQYECEKGRKGTANAEPQAATSAHYLLNKWRPVNSCWPAVRWGHKLWNILLH